MRSYMKIHGPKSCIQESFLKNLSHLTQFFWEAVGIIEYFLAKSLHLTKLHRFAITGFKVYAKKWKNCSISICNVKELWNVIQLEM